jgi:hypothetical protein
MAIQSAIHAQAYVIPTLNVIPAPKSCHTAA